MNTKKITILLLPILAIVIIATGVWYAQRQTPQTSPADGGTDVVVDNADDSVVDGGTQDGGVDTSGWKTYRNEEYGFEFKYPEDWDLDDAIRNDEIVSVSKYFINAYRGQDGSSMRIIIEENKHNSFEEWQEKNLKLFKNETVAENTNLSFQEFPANLIKSANPIAGGYNDRLAVFNEQKNLIYVIWSHRRIRTELTEANEAHKKILGQIVGSLKIDQ